MGLVSLFWNLSSYFVCGRNIRRNPDMKRITSSAHSIPRIVKLFRGVFRGQHLISRHVPPQLVKSIFVWNANTVRQKATAEVMPTAMRMASTL